MPKINLMTHIVAGYPDLETSAKLVRLMDANGVAYIEIQIPFSDPVADGPTIMKASKESLQAGTNTDDCLKLMSELSKGVKAQLLFMTYFNIVHAYGVERFCKAAKQAGAYGLIVPDIPLDEEPYEGYLQACRANNLMAIPIVTPNTSTRRLKEIAANATGFVYCVARAGTTGDGSNLTESDLAEYMQRVRDQIKLPLALGFGITNRDQAELAQKYADLVVIGSKVINVFDQEGLDGVGCFLEKISS